ncbi:MAG TPA: hypothetical protein VGV89_10115 [Thermoplasmata archaeon]|nr:hypothetical protein [Thermoplasmata archaeon]
MTNSCPGCGAKLDYDVTPGRLLAGECESCGGDFTVFEPGEATPTTGATEGAAGAEEGAGPGTPSASPLGSVIPSSSCPDCGGSLELQSAEGASLRLVCTECEVPFTFVPQRVVEVESSGPPRDSRLGRDGARPARPCRECGGQLKFTTGPDGMVSAECASCGNRFTLPPRRFDGGDRRGRFGPRQGGGGYRDRGSGGDRRWSGGGDRRRSAPPSSWGGDDRRRTGDARKRRRVPRD